MDNSYKFDNNFDRYAVLAPLLELLEVAGAGYEIKAFKTCTLITVTYVATYEDRKRIDMFIRGLNPVKTWKAPYQRRKEGVA